MIQGYFNLLVFALFWGQLNKKRRNSALDKMKKAPECLNNIYCVECGCNFIPMAFSDKPCIKDKPCFGTEQK